MEWTFGAPEGAEGPPCRADELVGGAEGRHHHTGPHPPPVKLDGRFHALDDACTVSWAMLSEGTIDRENRAVVCPQCKRAFDIETPPPPKTPPPPPPTDHTPH